MAEVKPKNVYQKIQLVRHTLSKSDLKKTGKNKHLDYNYFELGDFLPKLNDLMNEHGLMSHFSMQVSDGGNIAVLSIIDTDDSESQVQFSCPLREASMPNPIQSLGATITYLRRYLLMIAFEIAESDVVDATASNAKPNKPANRPVATKSAPKSPIMASLEQIKIIDKLAEDLAQDKDVLMEKLKIKSWKELTATRASGVIKRLEEIEDEITSKESGVTNETLADMSAEEVKEVMTGEAVITNAETGEIAH